MENLSVKIIMKRQSKEAKPQKQSIPTVSKREVTMKESRTKNWTERTDLRTGPGSRQLATIKDERVDTKRIDSDIASARTFKYKMVFAKASEALNRGPTYSPDDCSQKVKLLLCEYVPERTIVHLYPDKETMNKCVRENLLLREDVSISDDARMNDHEFGTFADEIKARSEGKTQRLRDKLHTYLTGHSVDIRTRLALQRTISEVAEFNLRGTGVIIDIDEFLKAIREFGAPISEEDEDFIRKEWIPSLSDAIMKRNFDDTIDRWILYSLDCAYASNVTFGHMNRTREEADSEYIHRVIERRDEVYAAVTKASVEVELDSEKTGSIGELGYFRRERKHKFNVKKSRAFISWLSETTPNAIFGKREKRSGKRGQCSVKLFYEAEETRPKTTGIGIQIYAPRGLDLKDSDHIGGIPIFNTDRLKIRTVEEMGQWLELGIAIMTHNPALVRKDRPSIAILPDPKTSNGMIANPQDWTDIHKKRNYHKVEANNIIWCYNNVRVIEALKFCIRT
ncbi:hypothetical protein WA026_001890 [Henosepilachna vigintioctopunctata]|uniref:Uncharacterized protein n=1 Tax=Henosepilachna vigintioctopunctata TaxID=420089 RepID=A0AAW1ULQ8_9CUCU